MQIYDDRTTTKVPLSSISIGEMFIDEDGDYMMKMTTITHSGFAYNVVNLTTGAVHAFRENAQCIKVNATIHITD